MCLSVSLAIYLETVCTDACRGHQVLLWVCTVCVTHLHTCTPTQRTPNTLRPKHHFYTIKYYEYLSCVCVCKLMQKYKYKVTNICLCICHARDLHIMTACSRCVTGHTAPAGVYHTRRCAVCSQESPTVTPLNTSCCTTASPATFTSTSPVHTVRTVDFFF